MMMHRETVVGGVVVLMAWAMVAGCLSRTTGNEGNLEFSFVADDNLLDFNKPIGVGARLELKVAEAGTRKRVAIESAKVDDEGVLKVTSFNDNKVVVEGVTDGSAVLEVQVKLQDGQVVTDSVNLLARTPEVMKLSHTCAPDEAQKALYLTGQRIVVPFELERANGQPVIGHGLYPVSFDPPEALTLDETIPAQVFLHLDTASEPLDVTISSEIDDTTLSMGLVNVGQVDGAELLNDAGFKALKDVPGIFYALPTVGGQRVCQAVTELTVVSDTPDICEVKHNANGNEGTGPEGELGFLLVTGRKVGVCQFTVTYPEANDGQGVAAPMSVDIIDVIGPEDEVAPEE